MAEICTSTIFNRQTRKVADGIIQAVSDLREYWPLTVRQIYYQLVSRLIIKNNIEEYRKVSRVGVKLRENELVPWYAIEDRTRRTTGKRGWGNVEQWLNYQFDHAFDPRGYGRCYVQNQSVYVEVSTEKDALSSIMEDELFNFCTRLNIVRGQVSATMIEQMADRFSEKAMQGLDPILLHFGDLDASGIAIPKAIQKNLYKRHGIKVDVRRIALTPDQVSSHNLPASIDAIKPQDPNYKAWLEEYGPKQPMVELDALHPDILKKILRTSLFQAYDMGRFEEQMEREKKDRELIKEIRQQIEDMLYFEYPEIFGRVEL